MIDWSHDQLTAIRAADEVQISTSRRDGSPRPPIQVGVVVDGGVDRDVTFVHVNDEALNVRLDAAYRSKYRRYGDTYVARMVAPQARAATIKIIPPEETFNDPGE
jgi:hypothetical protein